MTFKEMVAEECTEVFLNLNEFASLHLVDGREMAIQIDDSEVTEREKKQKERADGIYKRQFLFYVAQKEFGPLPTIGRKITIDRDSYRIIDANSEGGIYSITVERDKA